MLFCLFLAMRTTYKNSKKMKIVSIFCYREQIPHEMCPSGHAEAPKRARKAAESLRGNKNAPKCAPEGTFSSPRHRCNNFYYLCELWQHNME